MELDQAHVVMSHWISVEWAGHLLREAELEDIAHYFEYTAEDWAVMYLGA